MSQFPVDLPPTMLRTTLYTNKLIGNINVVGNITSNLIFAENIYGNLTSNNWYPGNVTDLNVDGNVTAGYFIGNGALLSGIAVGTLPSTANIDIVGNVSAPGNVIVAGQVNVTGNVTGEYFLGNGALLTGITAATLPGLANIDIIGNVTAPGNVIVAGQVNVVGNIVGQYFLGNGALLTGVTSTLPSSANIDITGNVIASNVFTQKLVVNSASISLGVGAGSNTNSVAIGTFAGGNNQNISAIAIGVNAGRELQGQQAIAIGYIAGVDSQEVDAVAIGAGAGQYLQGGGAVAIGSSAGGLSQGRNSVAIGYGAGTSSLTANSVAIGTFARANAANGSIVFNASGAFLTAVNDNSLTIDPIRGTSEISAPMMYNTTTKEVVYNTTGNVTADYFLGNGSLLTGLTASGVQNIDIRGNVSAPGNIVVSGQVNVTGNAVASFFVGNGSRLTALSPAAISAGTANVNLRGNVYGNTVVADEYVYTFGELRAGNVLSTEYVRAVSGVVEATNYIYCRGNIFGDYFFSNGSYLADSSGNLTLTGGNLEMSGQINAFGNIVAPFFVGNGALLTGVTSTLPSSANIDITRGNLRGSWANVFTANSFEAFIGNVVIVDGIVSAPSRITTNGNVVGQYFIGNGSQLTGITTSISAIVNGNSNVTVVQNGNISMAVGGVANVVTVTNNAIIVAGNIFNSAGQLYNVPASYVKYIRPVNQTGIGTGFTDVICNVAATTFGTDVSANITTGIFTLTSGKTYRLRGSAAYANFPSGGQNFFRYMWFNNTTSSFIGTSAQGDALTSTAFNGASIGGTAEATITPTVTTQVSLRVQSSIASTSIGDATSSNFPWVEIEVVAGQAPFTPAATANADIAGNIIGAFANVANIIAVQGNVGNTRFLGGNVTVSGQINTLGNVVAPFFIGNGSQLTGIVTTVPATGNIDIRGNVIGAFANVNTLNVTGNVVGNLAMIANTYVFRQPTTFFWNSSVFGAPNIAGNNILTATVVGNLSGVYFGSFYGWQFTGGSPGSYSTLNWTTGFDFRKDFKIDATVYISELGPAAADGMFFYIGGSNVSPIMTNPDGVTNGALSVSYDTYPSSNATIRSNGVLLNTTVSKISAGTWSGTVITCETLGGRRFLSLYTASGGVLEVSADVTSWTPRGNILSVGAWSGAVGLQEAYMNSIRLSYL